MAVQNVPSHARWSFQAGIAGLQQFQFCALNSSGQLIMPASSGVYAVVLDDAPNLQVSTVGTGGVVTGGYTVGNWYGAVFPAGCVMKVISGANLTPGQQITTDTSGHAVVVAGAGVALGRAITASSSGDIVHVFLNAV